MFDRYDPREAERARRDGFGREISQGSRGAGEKGIPAAADANDPRDVFLRDVDLPRGGDRARVRARTRSYELDGDDSRLLSTIGAFRVVHVEDLRDTFEGERGPRRAQDRLRHLRETGLVHTVPLESRHRDVVVLTKEGRELLEAHQRAPERGPGQVFYAGLRKPRELTHDALVYRAYRRTEGRLREGGGQVRRVVLDYELKRDYQRFLQERNRHRAHADGRPDRTPAEIAAWARERDLPCVDGHVHFPDARIEYEDREGRERHEDVEVVTPHYRGAHAGAARRSGFTCYRTGGVAVGGRGGRGRSPHVAEELLG